MFGFLFEKKKSKPIIGDDQAILPGNKVLSKLLACWPKFNPGRLWEADNSYIMPTRVELEKLLFDSVVDSYGYVSEILDCDDAALLLHADIIKQRYKDYKSGKIPKDQQFPLAFGQIWYQSSRGLHAVNICITRDEGVLLIEPQTDKIWKPKGDMFIDFVRF